jgi:hypothetical protein
MLIPVVPRETTIAFELGLTAPIADDHVCLQLAFVHGDCRGRRLIRVFSIIYPVSPDAPTVLGSVDEAALAAIFARRAATALLATGTTAAGHAIAKDVRTLFATGARYAAMYHIVHALLCNPAIRHGGALGVDARMAQLLQVRAMSVVKLLLFMYPRLIAVAQGHPVLPMTRRALEEADCFVLHSWKTIFIWVRGTIGGDALREAFGVAEFEELPVELPNLEGPMNREMHEMIQECWNFTGTYIPVEIVREGSPQDEALGELFVDDSVACGSDLRAWAVQLGAFV